MYLRFLSGPKAVLLPVAAMVFLALFPQLFFILKAGSWNGSYVASNYDEPAYSAYVNSLIEGKPRKNDPFTGAADSPATPQPETLYSIQFIPAYSIALPARILGLSVSTAFIILAVVLAMLSALALYWFLLEVTKDPEAAIIGPIVVLCFGTAAAFQGELRGIFDSRVLADYLPFLRRYQPGLAFPGFFVFCLLVWKAVRAKTAVKTVFLAAAAGSVFAALVFSYFYIWTAAAAWLVCFVAATMLFDRSLMGRSLITSAVVGLGAAAALVPYFSLLSKRSPNLDSVQLLSLTRTPEFASPSMWIGVMVVAASLILIKRETPAFGKLPLIISLSLLPAAVFNQQIITGRSLQPIHYELFIGNYAVLAAAVLLISSWRTSKIDVPGFGRGLAYLGLAAFSWGLFEAYGSTSRNFTAAEIRDATMPPVAAAVKNLSPAAPVILGTNFVTADFIPSVGSARALWNPHTSSAGGVGISENKRLFYMFLYFSGYGDRDLDAALRANSFEVTAAIFGSERALPSLGTGGISISNDEITGEVARYANFIKELAAQDAYNPAIDHIIVPAEAEPSFANLDRWYKRGEGQTFGLFRSYRLTPTSAVQ